jgi:hypothetical protein
LGVEDGVGGVAEDLLTRAPGVGGEGGGEGGADDCGEGEVGEGGA